MSVLGVDRLAYPKDHIEADNRLSWLLGRLEERYGDEATYVHLRRDEAATARSFAARADNGIMRAYSSALIWQVPSTTDPLEVAHDYLRTVNSNIALFLRDKTKRLDFKLENARQDLPRFWEYIRAEGDFDAAMAEFDVRHNSRA